MADKPVVFCILPFEEDFLDLYKGLKVNFKDDYELINAGDLDNQQNILQDIVEGIFRADVIVADLTGLNPNVFYELGLAHAMDKKVIIITQDIDELPFDIKSYRANEYSLKFNKMPDFMTELGRLISGAIDGSVKFGNPVLDYIPNFFANGRMTCEGSGFETAEATNEEMIEEAIERGYLDFIADIEENSNKMNNEIILMGDEMKEMSESVNKASDEINRTKRESGNVSASFIRNVCRKLSEPIDAFSGKLKRHIEILLDDRRIINQDNIDGLRDVMKQLCGMRSAMADSDEKIGCFINVLHGSLGMERRLNRAVTVLISELEDYLSMTDAISSSIDRIMSKGRIAVSTLQNMETSGT